jgi:hypothetical protein
MRALGLIALAGAGLGYLLCTENGRRMTQQAGNRMQDAYGKMTDYVSTHTGVPKMVREAVDEPHPDTAMATAFEEAVA